MDQIPEETVAKVLELKARYYSKGSIVRAITKEAGSKEKAKEQIEQVLSAQKIHLEKNPEIGRAAGSSEFKTGLVVIAIGVIIYIITGGRFLLVGGIILFGLWSLIAGALKHDRYK